MADYLARYHTVVETFEPPPDAQWHVDVEREPGMIIRHGDLGPWNTIWTEAHLVGVIDLDFAEPGYAIEDVAQFAWYAVPLRGNSHWKSAGFPEEPDYRLRLQTICRQYGVDAEAVLDVVLCLQSRERDRVLELGGAGHHPWSEFLNRGFVEEIEGDTAWILNRKGELLG